MAYDAGMLACVLSEINAKCADLRVEKIYQPAPDEVNIILKRGREQHRLLINAGSSAPRLSLTTLLKENPSVPPMFCMLLRKHMSGAHFVRAVQEGFERAAKLVFSCYDEMGYKVERVLHAEIMGKYSNLIFTDGEGKILGALKSVDFTTSSKRQVLPGMMYELPPSQNKTDPTTTDAAAFMSLAVVSSPEMPADKFICDTFFGVSRHTAREIVYRATGDINSSIGSRTAAVAREFCAWFERISHGDFSPTAIMSDGKYVEYSYFESLQYGNGADSVMFDSAGALLDAYFGERDRQERIRQRAADLIKLVTNVSSRLMRKLALLREELSDSEHGEEYRRIGDLITANIYRLKRGMTEFAAIDYSYDEPVEVTVELDFRLTPSQNAQKHYKKYTKARNAHIMLTQQIATAEEELAYIEGVGEFLSRAESEAELCEIREELYRSGYASRMKNYTATAQKSVKPRPTEFVTDSGYRLLVGKNNIQNDYITFTLASKGDLWFHVKGRPGSHVVLVCGGEEPSEKDYTQAAEVAAYYSSASSHKGSGGLVTVDYTRVKNIKRPPHARPGYVIYKTNYSANVVPCINVRKVTK